MTEPQLIKSLEKGLRILEIIGSSDSPVSMSHLSRMLNMNRSSIFRLLATLKARGYVINPVNSKAFVLGSAVHTLSNKSTWVNTLIRVSKKHLIALSKLTGETAHIAMLEGKQTIIVDNKMSPQSIGVAVEKGETGLIHCTSVGKALVLNYSRAELTAILGDQPLRGMASKTMTNVEDLANELDLYRPLGYVIDDEEYNDGVRCIGVPIFDATDEIVAAIGISAPIDRMPKKQFAESAKMVKLAADNISKDLGRTNAFKNYTNLNSIRDVTILSN